MNIKLFNKRCQDATRVFNLRLLQAFAFSKLLRWFEPKKVISLKTQQQQRVNAR